MCYFTAEKWKETVSFSQRPTQSQVFESVAFCTSQTHYCGSTFASIRKYNMN
jgi:hypothetical protein